MSSKEVPLRLQKRGGEALGAVAVEEREHGLTGAGGFPWSHSARSLDSRASVGGVSQTYRRGERRHFVVPGSP